MQEFINKLIERFEEQSEKWLNIWKDSIKDGDYDKYADGKNDAFIESIEIVNQLAEEYNNESVKGDLISRSALLKKFAEATPYGCGTVGIKFVDELIKNQPTACNDGWIHCSERLPSKEEIKEWATFLVTIRVRGKYDIMDFCLFGTDGKWLVSEDREVIAWKRQTPYQPKGE